MRGIYTVAVLLGLGTWGTLIAVALAITLSPTRWPYWLLAGWFTEGTFAALRLEMQYLGLWPEGLRATGGESPPMAVFNLKRCWLSPILAVIAWIMPSHDGLASLAMTYLVASAIWCPIEGFLSWRADPMRRLLPEETRAAWRHCKFTSTNANTFAWIQAAMLFSVWLEVGFARVFWIAAGVVAGIYLITTLPFQILALKRLNAVTREHEKAEEAHASSA